MKLKEKRGSKKRCKEVTTFSVKKILDFFNKIFPINSG